MERVNGIGGFFFRARDPAALAAWYSDTLGVELTPTDYDKQGWQQERGPTIFQPFSARLNLLRRAEANVDDQLSRAQDGGHVSQLQQAGIAVEVDPEKYPNGVFARLHDPEGNPIQLWQPQDSA